MLGTNVCSSSFPHVSTTFPSQAAALAVSSALHQTPPPPQQTYGGATPATPAYGGMSVVETSTAASTNSVLPENAAPNGVGPVAVEGRTELPTAATPPRLEASMSEPPVIEKEPAGAVDNGAFLDESGGVIAMVPPPSRPAEVSAEPTEVSAEPAGVSAELKRNKADESGPWAFAHAASDSGEQVKPHRMLMKPKYGAFARTQRFSGDQYVAQTRNAAREVVLRPPVGQLLAGSRSNFGFFVFCFHCVVPKKYTMVDDAPATIFAALVSYFPLSPDTQEYPCSHEDLVCLIAACKS